MKIQFYVVLFVLRDSQQYTSLARMHTLGCPLDRPLTSPQATSDLPLCLLVKVPCPTVPKALLWVGALLNIYSSRKTSRTVLAPGL